MSQQGPAKHASIAALLKAHPGKNDPKEIIRGLARAKVARAKKLGWEGPPFCPKELASINGIRCKEVKHEIGGDGRLLLKRDGTLLIEYRGGKMPERQRFTIFHEIAHTLFPDYCEFVPHHYSPAGALTPDEKEFENLCDVAAAEMLLPFDDFMRDLKKLSPGNLFVVHKLRERYVASIDATIHRLIDFEDRTPCAAVFLTDQKGKFEGTGPLWIKYSTRSKSFKTFIWPGAVPPQKSVTLACYLDGVDSGKPTKETWSIKGGQATWLVQAARLPAIPESPDYSKVVAFFVPS